MIRVEFLVEDVEVWLREHLFHPDTLVRLVLEPGVDWQSIVDEIEVHPAAWDVNLEERHKYLQETARQIAQDQRMLATNRMASKTGLSHKPVN